jgi:hypothetical protein
MIFASFERSFTTITLKLREKKPLPKLTTRVRFPSPAPESENRRLGRGGGFRFSGQAPIAAADVRFAAP